MVLIKEYVTHYNILWINFNENCPFGTNTPRGANNKGHQNIIHHRSNVNINHIKKVWIKSNYQINMKSPRSHLKISSNGHLNFQKNPCKFLQHAWTKPCQQTVTWTKERRTERRTGWNHFPQTSFAGVLIHLTHERNNLCLLDFFLIRATSHSKRW